MKIQNCTRCQEEEEDQGFQCMSWMAVPSWADPRQRAVGLLLEGLAAGEADKHPMLLRLGVP